MPASELNFENAVSTLVPLGGLNPSSQAEVLTESEILRFEPGELVFNEGDSDPYCFYILQGRVELSSQGETVKHVVGGTPDAAHALAQLQPRKMSARAESDAAVLRVQRDLLDKLAASDVGDNYGDVEVTEIDADDDGDWMTRVLQSKLFSQLPASNIQRIFSLLESVEMAKGDVVVEQGGTGDYYYIITQGRCEVTRAASAKAPDYRLAMLGPGEAFGEEALVAGTSRNATVRMVMDGELVRLPKADFFDLIQKPLLSSVTFEQGKNIESTKNALWLDVRFPEEHQLSGLEGSINHPLNTLRMHSGQLDSETTYIVYCDTGTRSAVAVFLLAERGFDVHCLSGGLMKYELLDRELGSTEGAAKTSALVDLSLSDDDSSTPDAADLNGAPVPTSHLSDAERGHSAPTITARTAGADEQVAPAAERLLREKETEIARAQAAAAHAERLQAEAEQARQEAERAALEQTQKLKAQAEQARIEAEQAAAEKIRFEREQIAAQAAQAQAQAERVAVEQSERLKAQVEQARIEAEQSAVEKIRLEREQITAQAAQARIEAERAAAEQSEQLKAQAEQARIEAEQAAAEKLRLEREQIAAQAAQARIEAEQAAAEKLRLEREQIAAQAAQARAEAERVAAEQAAELKAEAEQARMDVERAAMEQIHLEREQIAAETEKAKEELKEAHEEIARAKAAVEEELHRERAAQQERVESIRAEMQRRLEEEQQKLEETYGWQAQELERLKQQKLEAEQRLEQEREVARQEMDQARSRLAEARRTQQEIEQAREASTRETEEREHQQLELESRLRAEMQDKVQSEREELEQELARNAEELARARRERDAADAARAAAADEAEKIVHEVQVAHENRREQEEKEMEAARRQLEAESENLRLALHLAEGEKQTALEQQHDIEHEIDALLASQGVSDSSNLEAGLVALEQQARAVKAHVEEVERAQADVEAAAVATAGDLAAHKAHESETRAELEDELKVWLDEQENHESDDLQSGILANQRAHLDRIKDRAAKARQAAKAHDQSLIEELAQKLRDRGSGEAD